jgi:hypothetical protein
MSNEVVKQQAQLPEHFGYADEERDEDGLSGQLNTRIKFTNTAAWKIADIDVDITGKKYLAVNLRRFEIKWINGVREDVVELGPHDKFRDLNALNEACDKSEWSEGLDGKLRGPWQHQRVVELIDIATMDALSWPTSTTGGKIAIEELKHKIERMWRFRGLVYPLVELGHTRMKTRFGPRERPHLPVSGWYRIGEHGVESAEQSRLALDKASPQQQALQKVSEPSTSEELNDKIPW